MWIIWSENNTDSNSMSWMICKTNDNSGSSTEYTKYNPLRSISKRCVRSSNSLLNNMSNQQPEELPESTEKLDTINTAIQELPWKQRSKVSDGYHTFRELYEHRMTLFQALCNEIAHANNQNGFRVPDRKNVWKSKLHSDGTMYDNMFIVWIGTIKWQTLTYHIHISYWDDFWVPEIEKAPEWDGHTSEDVLRLLKEI